jgi:ABC-type glutathione transport system ATPase component
MNVDTSPLHPAPGPPLLELRGVTKAFRRTGVTAVDQVSLHLARGESLGLVGRSGAGKSTVGRLIAGLDRPDSGTIRLHGLDLNRQGRRERKQASRWVHLVFQDPYSSLAPHRRVIDLVAEPLVIHREAGQARRRVADALQAVCLDPDRYLHRWPHELSGGERQRVALARALVLRPDVVVADEPTAMLDPRVRAQLVALMRRLQHEHDLAWLLITHDLAVADGFCDRLVVMDGGSVVESGPTAEVVGAPDHPATAALVAAARRLERRVPA